MTHTASEMKPCATVLSTLKPRSKLTYWSQSFLIAISTYCKTFHLSLWFKAECLFAIWDKFFLILPRQESSRNRTMTFGRPVCDPVGGTCSDSSLYNFSTWSRLRSHYTHTQHMYSTHTAHTILHTHTHTHTAVWNLTPMRPGLLCQGEYAWGCSSNEVISISH